MTIEQIRASDKVMLVPADIHEILGCEQYKINVMAHECPEKLGFAVNVMGRRVRIPRLAFLHWLEYGNAPVVVNNHADAHV